MNDETERLEALLEEPGERVLSIRSGEAQAAVIMLRDVAAADGPHAHAAQELIDRLALRLPAESE
ncbi:hypothetical protein RB201_28230 [Streptomyces sp. S1A(2023)]